MTRDPTTLFRSSSFTTKMAEMFMRKVGRYFLKTALEGPIEHLLEEKEVFEVDPVKNTENSARILNATRLLEYAFLFWDSIYSNLKFLPQYPSLN